MVLEVVFPEMNSKSHTQSPMKDCSNLGYNDMKKAYFSDGK